MKNFPSRKVFVLVFSSLAVAFIVGAVMATAVYVKASSTSVFTEDITAGSLTTDIVDGSYVTVASPGVAMTGSTVGFTCSTVTGTFGTASQNIYVANPGAANAGWTLAVAAPAATNLWTQAGNTFDFNDPTSAGCADGADADSVGGQMSVDASVGALATGLCSSCSVASVSLGSASAFSEGATDSIGLLAAAAGSDDIGDWKLDGVAISQKIPQSTPAGVGYAISMVLSVVAI